MGKAFRRAIFFAAALLLISLTAAATPMTVRINQPTHNGVVTHFDILVSGTVETPPGLNLYVFVQSPQNVWLVQPPPRIDGNGRWSLRVKLGNDKDGNNQLYTIVAMLTPVNLAPGPEPRPLPAGLPRALAQNTVRVKRDDLKTLTVRIQQPANGATVAGPTLEVRGLAATNAGVGLYLAVKAANDEEWVIQAAPEVPPSGQWQAVIKLAEPDDKHVTRYKVRAFLDKAALKAGDRFKPEALPPGLVSSEVELVQQPESKPPPQQNFFWQTWLLGLTAAIISGLVVRMLGYFGEEHLRRWRGRQRDE